MRDGVHGTHVTRVVGEKAEIDVTVTPPKPLTDQVEPRQVEKQALSSEPDVLESYVISSNLKKDTVNLGKPLSSDLGDTDGLVKEEAQRRTETSAKKMDVVVKDNEMLPKAIEMEKSQHNPWTQDDGPTAMIYDTNLGWIDEPPGQQLDIGSVLQGPVKIKAQRKLQSSLRIKKEQAQLHSKSWIQTP